MRHDSRGEPKSPARRLLLGRLGLASVGGLAAAVGLSVAGSNSAQAQGYPPLPPPRREPPPPPPPGRAYVWEPGHWRWDGHRYDWRGGHYIPRRAEYRQFVPGHWANRHGTWVWVPQHWR